MTTIAECWTHYERVHLRSTIDHAGMVGRWKTLGAWFGTKDPEALTSMEVDEYVAERAKTVSASTVNREIGLLAACLNHSVRSRLIGVVVPIRLLPRGATKRRNLTEAQVSKLMTTADAGTWQERVFVKLALGTGARAAAICELTWDRVDIVIDFRVAHTKSARMKRRAVVPINKMVRAALGLADQHRNGAYVLHRNGVRLSNPRKMMQALAKRAGLKNCSAHVLRHTVASFLIAKNTDLLKVSRLLGHSSTQITEKTYVHTAPPWLKDTTDLLDF